MFRLMHLGLCFSVIGGCAPAAMAGPVSPQSFKARLAAAKGGETLVLAPGDYGLVRFPKDGFARLVTIDARKAKFAQLFLERARNVRILGGWVAGAPTDNYAVSIRWADNVTLDGMTISGAQRGVLVGESTNVRLANNRFTKLRSDGINIAMSQKVWIERNSCRDFTPIPAVFDAAGKMVRDGDHPDCIQAWSRPTHAPTSDITIVGNDIEGPMQGIGMFNHGNDGGFDRITVLDNRVKISFTHGVTVTGARDSVISGNTIDVIEGARLPNYPYYPVRPTSILEGSGNVGCGNRITALPKAPTARPCAAEEVEHVRAARSVRMLAK